MFKLTFTNLGPLVSYGLGGEGPTPTLRVKEQGRRPHGVFLSLNLYDSELTV
jgi:hypothetical protein